MVRIGLENIKQGLRRRWKLIVVAGGLIMLIVGVMLFFKSRENKAMLANEKFIKQTASLDQNEEFCPNKIVLETDKSGFFEIEGVKTQVKDEEIEALFKRCPDITKETSAPEPTQETAATATSSESSTAPSNAPAASSNTPASSAGSTASTPSTSTETPTQTPAASTPTPAATPAPEPTPTATPAETTPPAPTAYSSLSIITPYINESDIISINEAFSLDANSPWGFRHPGIDFMAEKDISVRAVTEGTIINLAIQKEENQMGWHAGFCIDHNPYTVCYNLETFSQEQAIGDALTANLTIKNGDAVKQGDVIGKLIYGGSGAHIDFGVIASTGSDRVCPEPYFTTDAKESVMRLIQKDHPTWPMCSS